MRPSIDQIRGNNNQQHSSQAQNSQPFQGTPGAQIQQLVEGLQSLSVSGPGGANQYPLHSGMQSQQQALQGVPMAGQPQSSTAPGNYKSQSQTQSYSHHHPSMGAINGGRNGQFYVDQYGAHHYANPYQAQLQQNHHPYPQEFQQNYHPSQGQQVRPQGTGMMYGPQGQGVLFVPQGQQMFAAQGQHHQPNSTNQSLTSRDHYRPNSAYPQHMTQHQLMSASPGLQHQHQDMAFHGGGNGGVGVHPPLSQTYNQSQFIGSQQQTNQSVNRRLFTPQHNMPNGSGQFFAPNGVSFNPTVGPQSQTLSEEPQREHTKAEPANNSESIFSQTPYDTFAQNQNNAQFLGNEANQQERYDYTLTEGERDLIQPLDNSMNPAGSQTHRAGKFRTVNRQKSNEVMIINIDKSTLQLISKELFEQDAMLISGSLIGKNILTVRFKNHLGAQWAINHYDGKIINGRRLQVTIAIGQSHQPGRRHTKWEPPNLAQINESNDIDEEVEQEYFTESQINNQHTDNQARSKSLKANNQGSNGSTSNQGTNYVGSNAQHSLTNTFAGGATIHMNQTMINPQYNSGSHSITPPPGLQRAQTVINQGYASQGLATERGASHLSQTVQKSSQNPFETLNQVGYPPNGGPIPQMSHTTQNFMPMMNPSMPQSRGYDSSRVQTSASYHQNFFSPSQPQQLSRQSVDFSQTRNFLPQTHFTQAQPPGGFNPFGTFEPPPGLSLPQENSVEGVEVFRGAGPLGPQVFEIQEAGRMKLNIPPAETDSIFQQPPMLDEKEDQYTAQGDQTNAIIEDLFPFVYRKSHNTQRQQWKQLVLTYL